MALPLAATLQPIEQPIVVAAEAELLMVYGPGEAANVDVDFYLDLQSVTVANYQTGTVYSTSIPGCLPPDLDPCATPITSMGMPGWLIVDGVSTLLLTWLDVATFFWFHPPGDMVTDFVPPTVGVAHIPALGQPCPPPETAFCLPDSTPLAPTLGESVCPPGSVIWADALDPWDSGLTCWDQPV